MTLLGRREFLLGLLGAGACGLRPSPAAVRTYPDPVLRRMASPVGRVDDAVRRLAACLDATMSRNAAFGIAAPQIGVPLRVVVARLEGRSVAMVNPVVTNSEGRWEGAESCLSLPDRLKARVARRRAVTIAYWDLGGDRRTRSAIGHEAAILQHELDHLNGRLYIDYSDVS